MRRRRIRSFCFVFFSSEWGLIAILPPYAETQPSAGLLITGPPKGYQHCFYTNRQPGQADSTRMLCSSSYETGSSAMAEDLLLFRGHGGRTPHRLSSWRWGRADPMQGNLDFTPRQLLVIHLLTPTITDTHRIDSRLWKTPRFMGFGYCWDQLCALLAVAPHCRCSYLFFCNGGTN